MEHCQPQNKIIFRLHYDREFHLLLHCMRHFYFSFFTSSWAVKETFWKRHPSMVATSFPSGQRQLESTSIWSISVITNALWSTAPFSWFQLHITLSLKPNKRNSRWVQLRFISAHPAVSFSSTLMCNHRLHYLDTRGLHYTIKSQH